PDGLGRVASLLRRHGVGRVMFTTTTYPLDLLLETLKEFDRQLGSDPALAKLYCGNFFEGRYISPDPGWRGAHESEHCASPSWDEWRRIVDVSGNRTKIFNIEPSHPG